MGDLSRVFRSLIAPKERARFLQAYGWIAVHRKGLGLGLILAAVLLR